VIPSGRDFSMKELELSLSQATNSLNGPSANGNISNNKYKVKPPRQLKSQFIIKQEAKQVALKNADKLKSSQPKLSQGTTQAEGDQQAEDELQGLRIHAWVLILPGKREISEAFFIEPSTGEIYPTDHDYYLGVESVFSSTNYWVNMQVCYDGLKGISFDLGDNLKWEFVFLDNNKPSGVTLENKNEAGSDDEDNVEQGGPGHIEVLDLPPSWVDKLFVSREQYESKCPSGAKEITYKNVKVESFAEYNRPDGMVLRLTHFEGDLAGQVNEYYENRKDKLYERLRIPEKELIKEFFHPGRVHGLKEHIIEASKTKEMHFYPGARSDGLFVRLEFPNKVKKFKEHSTFPYGHLIRTCALDY
jgi:hypothetical protein